MARKLKWSKRSLAEMSGIHPDLRRLCDRTLEILSLSSTPLDIMIIDGKRSLEEQKRHVASGASKTLKSRHLHGLAIDFAVLVSGKLRWEDAYYAPVRAYFKQAAKELGLRLEKDIPWDTGHIALHASTHPDPG
jgi:peptidoglycan L-alanyl-D-glutamate endopeptidase CwlK